MGGNAQAIILALLVIDWKIPSIIESQQSKIQVCYRDMEAPADFHHKVTRADDCQESTIIIWLQMSNRILKNILVNVLSNDWISAVATRVVGCGIPIFMLHRTYPDNTPGRTQTPSYLRQCLSHLKKKGYHFTSVTDVLRSITDKTPLPSKPVAFTIDDGFHDQASLAAPVFLEFKCPVTIFLVTDFIDGKVWPWFSKVEYIIENTKIDKLEFRADGNKITFNLNSNASRHKAIFEITESIKRMDWSLLADTLNALSKTAQIDIPLEPPEQFRPISWEIVKKLEDEGISFGPHTLTHPILSKVSHETAAKEIIGSWLKLKNKLKNPAPVFCYPNGRLADYGDREIQILKNNELLGALSTVPMQFRSNFKSPDVEYKVPRYSLPDNFNDFIMYCSWIELAKEKLRGQQI